MRNIEIPINVENRSTLVGCVAVVSWSQLALLTVLVGAVPAFQLAAFCFGISGIAGSVWLILAGDFKKILAIPVMSWCHGVIGIFGYHFFYFTGMRHGSATEISLIAYLWPLLIIILASVGQKNKNWLKYWLGGVLGFSGVVIILLSRRGEAFSSQPLGYICAVCCALIWSAYSVLNKKSNAPSNVIITGVCVASCLLSFGCHILFEKTFWPQTNVAWIAMVCLGLGPVGLAFFCWDYGTKNGKLMALAAFSYFAPLISTVTLFLFEIEPWHYGIVIAAIVISLSCIVTIDIPPKYLICEKIFKRSL